MLDAMEVTSNRQSQEMLQKEFKDQMDSIEVEDVRGKLSKKPFQPYVRKSYGDSLESILKVDQQNKLEVVMTYTNLVDVKQKGDVVKLVNLPFARLKPLVNITGETIQTFFNPEH